MPTKPPPITMTCFILSNGVEGEGFFTNDLKRTTCDQPEVYGVIQKLADLENVEGVAPTGESMAGLGMGSFAMLATGRIGSLVEGAWCIGGLAIILGVENLGVGVIPKFKVPVTLLWGCHVGIHEATEHPDEAFLLVKEKLSEYSLRLSEAGTDVPPQPKYYTSEGQKLWVRPNLHPPEYPELVKTTLFKGYGRMPRFSPYFQQIIDEYLAPAWESVFNQTATAEEAFTSVAPDINKVLAGK